MRNELTPCLVCSLSAPIAYALISIVGISTLVLWVGAIRLQSAYGRQRIAEMEARHAREIAAEERILADYRAELGAT